METTKKQAVKQILEILQDNENINVSIITLALRAQNLPKEVHMILKIMKENDLAVEDINKALRSLKNAETFDLVCNIDGKLTRLPYEEGEKKNPIGICPCKKHNFFLYLDESGEGPFPPIEEKDQLLDELICNLIMPVRPELNEKLRKLGKPLLSGDYWLNGHELSGIGYWMARIREDELHRSDDPRASYDNVNCIAKVRKIGRL